MDTKDKIIQWLLSNDTGLSANAIVAQMTGIEIDEGWSDYPRDCADFGRCHRLLETMPEFKIRIEEMAQRSPQWAVLVQHWDELTQLYLAKSSRMYARMLEILSVVPTQSIIEPVNNVSVEILGKD